MTDIVERLRADAAAERRHAELLSSHDMVTGAAMFFERAAMWEKAATEIENLRIIVDEEEQRHAATADEIEKLRTILREARNALGAASPFMFASRTTPTQSSVAVLADLVARLEAATGPDRELDADIYIAIHIPTERAGRIDQHDGFVGWWPTDAAYVSAVPVPHYTDSIDAALTLVPEGAEWTRHRAANGLMTTRVDAPTQFLGGHGQGATPAIELCIAALKARAAP